MLVGGDGIDYCGGGSISGFNNGGGLGIDSSRVGGGDVGGGSRGGGGSGGGSDACSCGSAILKW